MGGARLAVEIGGPMGQRQLSYSIHLPAADFKEEFGQAEIPNMASHLLSLKANLRLTSSIWSITAPQTRMLGVFMSFGAKMRS
jgi:hypothetical protein